MVAVDDCSRDDTVELLRGFGDPRIRVIASETNGGPAVARNHAFAAARGHYVAGLDQDDVCVPERFARQVAYLDAHPEVALASTAAAVLEDGRLTPGNWPRPLTPGLIDWLILIQNPLVWSSVMFRADAARRLDPFERPEFRYVEDFDFYHRIRAFGRLAQIDEELVRYRAHAGGASNMFNATMRANAETLMRGHAPDIADLLVRHVRRARAGARCGDACAVVPGHRPAARRFRPARGHGSHDAGAGRPRDLAAVVAVVPRGGALGGACAATTRSPPAPRL
ncbi:MAG: glycosyltransferase [Sphingomonas sp.]